MVEIWHEQFSPKQFLSRVNIDGFIKHNEANNKNKVELLGNPCILCKSSQGPGLLLNDKSYLCKSCFADVSIINYPEKYENLYRQYFKDREARNEARTELEKQWQKDREAVQQSRKLFIATCPYRKISYWAKIAIWGSLILICFYSGSIVVS